MWHQGRAWFIGADIDTDQIMPTPYLALRTNEDLGRHVLSGNDPAWPGRFAPGDVLFAGANFGCGSSREHAPRGLKGAGIACVVAPSFARIFFRNAINIGLPLLILPEVQTGAGGEPVWVDSESGQVRRSAEGPVLQGAKPPGIIRDILAHGGLMPYVKARSAAVSTV
ncbi:MULTISPECIES: 3-isopropylmalate dehydratase [Ramlibacter]|uniref:3-isopropylmalate dehydratase small subunit n=1 Tax=Ramlibacter pinisoli TaxID=2682844 RepID=A0A6N8J0H4_9BURK|nr:MULTISPECIES: 3-isopropylmalate dehydratase [Ramlibacter]MBA2962380.1 3-isopropylmalate dehydratase [Ramlibacter sp. CGMCC 1.13660]MVQ32322.1 3-isopropylmalate dehydratase [Ramlibacter pinisoli]